MAKTREIMDPHIADEMEPQVRPHTLQEFIGQHQLKENLGIFIDAAKSRNQSLDHVLFYGPPGLGKTTLAQIIARELGVNIRISSGPMLSKPGDLAAILTNLSPNDVLFIDEIHRLNNTVEEVLYPAMEDFYLDIIIGEGPAARTVKIDLPKFTLVGATTRLGMLTNPLRDRFGIPLKLQFYTIDELFLVITRNAKILGVSIHEDACSLLAQSSRGTPRIAIRLLKRICDFAHAASTKIIDIALVKHSLKNLGVDSYGLDGLDHSYIKYIAKFYDGGPVGIETIAAGLSEDKDTIEDTIEPYLMQIGFVSRTPRGRMLTESCQEYFRALSWS